MAQKYFKPILIGVVALIVLFLFVNRATNQEKEIIEDKTLDITENAKDFHLSTNGMMIFDGKKLYFCDKNFDFLKSVSSKDRELEVFFDNNYAFLYDADLKKVFEYKDTGELLNTITLDENLYNVKYLNKNIVFHMKGDGDEVLSILRSDGSLEEIYRSSNAIMSFDVYDESTFAVAELELDATGYKSILNARGYNNLSTEEFNSEGALCVFTTKNEVLMVTDKNMYVFGNDETKHIEVPNVTDVLIKERSIYLLHSGILSKYNFNLEEQSKQVLAANVNHLAQIANSVYAYGNSDIGGDLGKKSQFYKRLGFSADEIKIFGVTIGTLKNGRIRTFKIVNKRSLTSESTPVGAEE
ncbi:hypothetical protein [Anaerosphaera multitolerans]|uniref:Uncharacterized protein n=1 Tax=Anaerosphaera multitolerans TaxID=2487351 RepID=A0A437S825_9FIRM|nr:hypothetical protein [Anaerosphaera multitolerans]RVU55068.1 hypothetical protein EF514_04040 [Anaerosphaera multitolerans]